MLNQTTFTELVSSVQAVISNVLTAQEQAAKDFQASSRLHTYNVIASIYDFGWECLKPENERAFIEALLHIGVAIQPDANPWHYISILAVSKSRNEGGLTKWTWSHAKTYVNRAPVLRALHALRIKPGSAAQAIELFQRDHVASRFPDHAEEIKKRSTKGLEGLRQLDAILNPSTRVRSDDEYIERLAASEPLDLATYRVTDHSQRFVLILGVVDDGAVVPIGIVSRDIADAEKAAVAFGRAASTSPSKGAVDAVTEDKLGALVFGDEVGSTSAPRIVIPGYSAIGEIASTTQVGTKVPL